MSAVRIGPVTAKRRHLSDNFTSRDQHDAEVGSYGKSLLKQSQHLIRQSAGGDVKVLRFAAHQQVPDAATYKVSLLPGGAQPGDDLRCRIPRCIRSHTYYYRKVSQTNGLILAIESSCDETAAAVGRAGIAFFPTSSRRRSLSMRPMAEWFRNSPRANICAISFQSCGRPWIKPGGASG